MIGVNRSYQVAWAPIAVSADYVAAQDMLEHARACLYVLYRMEHPQAITIQEKIGASGRLALWFATLLRPTQISLLGFDMSRDPGHFYDVDWIPRMAPRAHQRLWNTYAKYVRGCIPVRIWADGWKDYEAVEMPLVQHADRHV